MPPGSMLYCTNVREQYFRWVCKVFPTCQKNVLDVTIDVGTLVFPQDSFRLLDHLIGFLVRPGKQCLLQISLQHLQKAVGVGVIMDTAIFTQNSNGTQQMNSDPTVCPELTAVTVSRASPRPISTSAGFLNVISL